LGNCWDHRCLPKHLMCRNNATLHKNNAQGYHCHCADGWMGDSCEIVLVPSPTPPPISSPIPSPVPTPTAQAVSIKQIKHQVTFTNLDSAAAYNNDVALRGTYEVGYAASINCYDFTTQSFESECSVSSSASRRTAVVTFQAQVQGTRGDAATTAAQQLDGQTLASNMATAAATLGRDVSLPQQGDMQLASPTVTVTSSEGDPVSVLPSNRGTASSGSSSESVGIVIGCVVGGVLLLTGVLLSVLLQSGACSKKREKAAVDVEPPRSCVYADEQHAKLPGVNI